MVLREFRVPIAKPIWCLPAGLKDGKESDITTAARELMEEAGLTIREVIRCTKIPTRTSPGLTDEKLSMVFVKAEGIPHTHLLEATEDIEVFLMSREEVKKILDSGEEIDSKAYLVMLRFAEDGKI